jgi:hypothetical protein
VFSAETKFRTTYGMVSSSSGAILVDELSGLAKLNEFRTPKMVQFLYEPSFSSVTSQPGLLGRN